MNYSNSVFNHPAIFSNLQFGLTWCTDGEMRKNLMRKYRMWEMSYPDEEVMAQILQDKAHFLMDEFNKLYETTKYKYNPIENYDMEEEVNIDTNNNSSSTGHQKVHQDQDSESHGLGESHSFQNPMGNSTNKKEIESATSKTDTNGEAHGDSDTESSSTGAGQAKVRQTTRRHGNIGVTTSQQMIQAERELILCLEEEYCAKFKTCFMLTI